MESQYCVLISTLIDNEVTELLLDTVGNVSIDETSTITSEPIITGDYVGDHMYRNPISMSIPGTFSLNGSKGIVVTNAGAKLSNVQTLFERIKDEALECTITKVSVNNSNDVKFLQRDHMYLNGIHWTEQINSLDFIFNFKQVLKADVISYDVDLNDSFLPNVNEPQTLNFTDVLLDKEEVLSKIIDILENEEICEHEFLQYLSTLGKAALTGLGIGALVALVIAAKVTSLVTAIGTGILGVAGVTAAGAISATGIGAIVIAATVVAISCYVGIYKVIKQFKYNNKYKIRQFKKYKNEKKTEKEVKRFGELMEEFNKALEELNKSIQVYSITSNVDQECLVTIDDNYYIFTFVKNNNSEIPYYSLTVKDTNNNNYPGTLNVGEFCSSDFSQLTDERALFKTTDNTRVFLLNSNEDIHDLMGLLLVVSKISMTDYNNLLHDIIYDVLLRD